MKIKHIGKPTTVPVSTLSPGDVFLWEGKAFVKRYWAPGEDSVDHPFPTMRADNGYCGFFATDVLVTPFPNATLVLEES